MWLRKCGVPPFWPSRVKVIVLGLFKTTIIITICQYLSEANIGYLDRERPAKREPLCQMPFGICAREEDPARCMEKLPRKDWTHGFHSEPKHCVHRNGIDYSDNCATVALPLSLMDGMGLRTAGRGINPVKAWTYIFLLLVVLEDVCIVWHDLTMIDEHHRNNIWTLVNLREHTPRLWRLVRWAGNKFAAPEDSRESRRARCIFVFSVPLRLFLQIVVFVVVTFPYTFAVFLCHPRRMCRIIMFSSNIFCVIVAILFASVFAADFRWPTHYSVLWNRGWELSSMGREPCVCRCEYPLKRAVDARLIILGLSILLHSVNIALLSLKGLRQAHWASLISVMYTVPIGAFPVFWNRALPETNAGPVNHRAEGEPCQGEPAFDPFCLMDEQPESGITRVSLIPVLRSDGDVEVASPYVVEDDMGCCGFPKFTEMVKERLLSPLSG